MFSGLKRVYKGYIRDWVGDLDRIRVRLVNYTRNGDRIIAAAAKLSLSRKNIEDLLAMPDSEVETWIIETWKRQHFSPWEHSSYTWIAEGCSRICTHQLVRHRLASYTQQSMRYTEGVLRNIALKSSELLGLDCPPSPKKTIARNAYLCYAKSLANSKELDEDTIVSLAKEAYVFPPTIIDRDLVETAVSYLEATAQYYRLLASGVPREDARFVIPHAVRTRIIVTMNARELVQSFLPLRMCTRAQWELRHVSWMLWNKLMEIHPRLFKWTGPRCVFNENTSRRDPQPLVNYINGSAEFTIERCPELVPREGVRSCLLYAWKFTNSGPPRSRSSI